MTAFQDLLRQYDYVLPKERIAQAPATPRDSSKLLVYDRKTGEKTHAVFRDMAKFLPANALVVLNNTKVIPARLRVTRSASMDERVTLRRAQHDTQSTVELLWLSTGSDGLVRVLSPKKLRVNDILMIDRGRSFMVIDRIGAQWILRPSFAVEELEDLLNRKGTMPLPPYIDRSPLTPAQVKKRYQTVFAKTSGSIAAPTASLHFTPRVFESLKKRGIETAYVTLHVHLGTFARLTEDHVALGKLHLEEYVIAPESMAMIEQAKKEGRPIVAVGTTVVRTLESAFDPAGKCIRPSGATDLFIQKGYRFRMVDHLITNFHVPQSSLLMLVSAFAGREKIMELYQEAMDLEYRFFSFGDGMVIL